MKIGIIFNPAAGKNSSILLRNLIQEKLMLFKGKFLLFETKFPGHSKELVLQMLSSGVEKIAVVGGDGTINEVGTSLIKTNIPLSIIPSGIGNDYHKNFNIPHSPKEAIELFLSENYNIKKCDGGKVWDNWFFNGFGVGFEGSVCNSSVTENIKEKENLFKSIAKKKILFYKPFQCVLKVNNKEVFNGFTFQVSASIGKSVGKSYKIAPFSKVDDNLFHITLIPQTSILNKIKILKLIEKGKHLNNPNVRIYKGKSLSIDIKNNSVEAHRDGLPFNIEHKAELKIHSKVLNIIERSKK